MAKKSAKTDRQAVIEQMRKQQKGAEQRRGLRHRRRLRARRAADRRRRRRTGPVKNWWDLRQFKRHRPRRDRRSGLGVRAR